MELRFLGGAGEVGRSALLVDDRLLLDAGLSPGDQPRTPVGLRAGGGDLDPEAVVVSHGHLDHAGAVPALLGGEDAPAVHWTPPTRALARVLAEDTLDLHGRSPRCPFTREHVLRLGEASVHHGYGEPFETAGYEVTLYDAGHLPGSAHVLVDDGETRLLYTGDFHTDDQRLVGGTTARPDADVVVTESTYADVEHSDRAGLEARFARRVRETLDAGGRVVAPAFAVGRTQELLLVCEAHDLPCYVDGMGRRVTRLLGHHPASLRDPEAYDRARGHARFVEGGPGQRERVLENRAVVVTTAGMLTGGPAMDYVPAVAGNPANLVALAGYQVEGTPGRELLETGAATIDGRHRRVAAAVELFDFSAHADRDGLRAFLGDYPDARVLAVHGDRCAWFAEELRAVGYDAAAPAVGETVVV